MTDPSRPAQSPPRSAAPPKSAPPPQGAVPKSAPPPPPQEPQRLTGPVDPGNGERGLTQQPPAEPSKYPTFDRYVNAGTHAFAANIQEKLAKPVSDEIVEITPDGRVYVPAGHFRNALNEAFGRGGWTMLPWTDRIMKGGHMYREYALYALGQFVAEAVGEQEYIETNTRFTYGDAAEGCKSNAIMRCCKELGIYNEIWDPGWRASWRDRMAVRVECRNNSNQKKRLWRRRDRGRLISGQWFEMDGQETRSARPGASGSATSGQKAPAQGAQKPAAQGAPSKPSSTGQKPQGAAQPSGQGAPPGSSKGKSGGGKRPDSTLHQKIMAALKQASGGKEDDARKLFAQLTGKRRLHECDEALLQALVLPIQKLARSEARVEEAGEGIVLLDVTTNTYIWPPNYQPPGGTDAPPDVQPDAVSDAPPPVDDDAPPPDDDGPPPTGEGDYGF